jgi:hypothetical protein
MAGRVLRFPWWFVSHYPKDENDAKDGKDGAHARRLPRACHPVFFRRASVPPAIQRKLGNRLAAIVLLLYGVSFLLPAWGKGGEVVYGWGAFVLGMVYSPFLLVFLFQTAAATLEGRNPSSDPSMLALAAWLANPCFWVGHYYLARWRWGRAAFAGILALALGFGFYRAGGTDLRIGYYFWVASMALLPLLSLVGAGGAALGRRRDFRPPPDSWPPDSSPVHQSHEPADRVAPGHPPPGPPRAGL